MNEQSNSAYSDSEHHQILFVFSSVRRSLNRVALERLKAIKLGFKQAIILRALTFEQSVTCSELALRTMTDPAALSRIIHSLEKKGFLRKGILEADRRSWKLEVTAKGRKLASQVNETYREIDELIRASLSSKEQDALVALLQKVENHLTTERAK